MHVGRSFYAISFFVVCTFLGSRGSPSDRRPPRWTSDTSRMGIGKSPQQNDWIELVLSLAQGDTVKICPKIPDALSELQHDEDRA